MVTGGGAETGLVTVGMVACLAVIGLTVWAYRHRFKSPEEQRRILGERFDGRETVYVARYYWSLSKAEVREVAAQHGYVEWPGMLRLLIFSRTAPPTWPPPR